MEVTMSATLSDVELLAVTKAVATKIAKTAREGVNPGEYTLSFDAHIEGTVRVGNDYEQPMPNKTKPWNIISVLLEELEKTRAAAGMTGIDLDKVVAMADALDDDLAKAAKEKAEEKAAALKAATLTPCKGKVTAKLSVSPVRG